MIVRKRDPSQALLRTLENKRIFITGGSRGIGVAIALRAARDGAKIAFSEDVGRASEAEANHPLGRRSNPQRRR